MNRSSVSAVTAYTADRGWARARPLKGRTASRRPTQRSALEAVASRSAPLKPGRSGPARRSNLRILSNLGFHYGEMR
jgi:hypothetical protein